MRKARYLSYTQKKFISFIIVTITTFFIIGCSSKPSKSNLEFNGRSVLTKKCDEGSSKCKNQIKNFCKNYHLENDNKKDNWKAKEVICSGAYRNKCIPIDFIDEWTLSFLYYQGISPKDQGSTYKFFCLKNEEDYKKYLNEIDQFNKSLEKRRKRANKTNFVDAIEGKVKIGASVTMYSTRPGAEWCNFFVATQVNKSIAIFSQGNSSGNTKLGQALIGIPNEKNDIIKGQKLCPISENLIYGGISYYTTVLGSENQFFVFFPDLE